MTPAMRREIVRQTTSGKILARATQHQLEITPSRAFGIATSAHVEPAPAMKLMSRRAVVDSSNDLTSDKVVKVNAENDLIHDTAQKFIDKTML